MEKVIVTNAFMCTLCNYSTIKRGDYNKHCSTKKHNGLLSANTAVILYCSSCQQQCKNQEDYNRHVQTTSHLVKHHGIIECSICNKIFVNESGLWKHSKKCKEQIRNKLDEKMRKEIDNKNAECALINTVTPEMFMALARNNNELCQVIKESQKHTEKLVELALKNGYSGSSNNTNTNSTVNSHNKQVNIQLFLNETCKDALNFSEFMNSIKLSLEDLEKTGQLGYVEGMSRILVNALNKTTLEKRPLHCTDIKKETVYIKESDKWDKENKDKENLNRAIQYISEKNLGKIKDWKEENPDALETNSEKSEVLNQLYANVFSKDDNRDNHRIIKNVLSEVVLNNISV